MASLGVVCMILNISLLATPTMAATYIVGDSNGWNLGVDYTTWAGTKTFKVDDSLVFNYGISHSVLEVSSSEYNSCSLGNAMSADRSGATTITLKTLGRNYFVCGVPSHCDGGQKLAITVLADDTATPFGRTAAAPPSGNTIASKAPAVTANAPTSTKIDNVPQSSFAASLSPTNAARFFMACVIVFVVSKLV